MSSFVLKIIAAVSMFFDHMGVILFPDNEVLRIIGRLAFPLYAFCIAEGFLHTRNRLRYFLQIFILGALCQIVYFFVEEDIYLGILITFSFSIVLMALTDCVKKAFRGEESPLASLIRKATGQKLSLTADQTVSLFLTLSAAALFFYITRAVTVDYDFFGILLPVSANLFEDRWKRVVAFCVTLTVGAVIMSASFPVQIWCLLTIPLIVQYNGQPGRYRLKYFFYIFYPAHMALLYAISLLR